MPDDQPNNNKTKDVLKKELGGLEKKSYAELGLLKLNYVLPNIVRNITRILACTNPCNE